MGEIGVIYNWSIQIGIYERVTKFLPVFESFLGNQKKYRQKHKIE